MMTSQTQQAMSTDSIPSRVVSLVPSITRSMMDFGLSERIIGITEYCEPGGLAGVVRVGGTLTPRIDLIRELDPDYVIANVEENPKEIVTELTDAGIEVWVTFPKTISDCINDLWHLARRFGILERVSDTITSMERTVTWLHHASEAMPRKRVFCPIWFDDWWMTINEDTYVHSVVELCGGANIFASRERKYPLESDIGETTTHEVPGSRDVRYPRVTTEEIKRLDPELILLPDEPYSFGQLEVEMVKELLRGISAISDDQVFLVEGRWLTWFGTTLAEAMRQLPQILQVIGSEGS
jgi:ABC-type Fe3+-hydroxamate transport system substrate-binding protein